ncbi:hypothetical protein OS493_030432 [Desmophyllum pertusum]|uniref:Ig-like domain-containing protein n=1 Tax=Desmophyllum pertusum TaxID=174260 RepID=A0A9W9Z9H1_9CNID|nr:hypothetical protein OS493_030432 [Desmophyllum pertusum]
MNEVKSGRLGMNKVKSGRLERLALDESLTRKDITTLLGHAVNLGCYVTKTINTTETLPTQAPSPLTYVWSKDNNSVPQAPHSIHGNVLVVTPGNDTDFGIYVCNVTNGVSSTGCRIELMQGWTKSKIVTNVTGCVNVSVLMPVLAVAVLSFLLFIHLIIRRKDNRRSPEEIPQQQQGQHRRSSVAHPHEEQRTKTRRLSRDLLYHSFREEGSNNNESKQGVVSIEMHVGGDLHSTPTERKTVENLRRDRKPGFYNKSFRSASMELEDGEDASHVSGEGETDEGQSFERERILQQNFLYRFLG